MRIRVLAGSLLSFLAMTGVALAGSPQAGHLYTSTYLTIDVGKPATKAKVFIECLPGGSGGAGSGTWYDFVPLKKGSINFDRKETLSKLPKGKEQGTVKVTAKFTGGKFVGTWQLVGTSCGKTRFTATEGAGGSGR
jgi:hypothetical protein